MAESETPIMQVLNVAANGVVEPQGRVGRHCGNRLGVIQKDLDQWEPSFIELMGTKSGGSRQMADGVNCKNLGGLKCLLGRMASFVDV